MPSQSDSENMHIAPAVETTAGHRLTGSPPRPGLAGCRLSNVGGSELFVVDAQGYRRRIPNYTTYSRLFRDWSGIAETPDLENIAARVDLAIGTILIRGDRASAIYLLDQGRRRAVSSQEIMNKYWFNWERVFVIRQVLVDHMPLGEDWE